MLFVTFCTKWVIFQIVSFGKDILHTAFVINSLDNFIFITTGKLITTELMRLVNSLEIYVVNSFIWNDVIFYVKLN